MGRRGNSLLDLDWAGSWRRPDGTARDKPPAPRPKEEIADYQPSGEQVKACERELLRRLWWVGAAVAVAAILNIWAVRLGRGSYMHISLVLDAILLLGAPAFLISLVLMCVGRDKHSHIFLAGFALNLVSLVIFLMLVSACIGLFVATADVKDAMAYCEAMIPRLEKHKQDTGKYPDALEAVASREHEPRLLRGRQFYVPQPNGYVLEFRRPQKKWELIEYISWTGRWESRK